MGCLSVSASRIGASLKAVAVRVAVMLSLMVSRADGHAMSVSCERSGDVLPVHAKRRGGRMKVNCGLVCSLNSELTLKIEPEYIWLMESNQFTEDVVVWSNVEWTVS